MASIADGAIQARYQAIAPFWTSGCGGWCLPLRRQGGRAWWPGSGASATGSFSRDDSPRHTGVGPAGRTCLRRASIRPSTGGGRKRTVEHDPSWREDVDRLVQLTSRGDPEYPLRWTLQERASTGGGIEAPRSQVSHRMVAELLHDMAIACKPIASPWRGLNTRTATLQFAHSDRAGATATRPARAGDLR